MVGYIFKAENTVTKKVYIGKRYSVRFDKKYIGDAPEVVSDAKKYGVDKFIVNMLKACETVKECDLAYDVFLKELHAKDDEKFYNYEPKILNMPEDEKHIKRARKKKVTEK